MDYQIISLTTENLMEPPSTHNAKKCCASSEHVRLKCVVLDPFRCERHWRLMFSPYLLIEDTNISIISSVQIYLKISTGIRIHTHPIRLNYRQNIHSETLQ